jgi:predicted HicB family RNase H-like nuclease
MKYKGYIGIAEFDEEAEIFFGRVVNIRDTITFEATDARKLRKEFEASVDDYLEFCRTKGREPEHGYSGKFSLRLPPELHERIAASAAIEGKSLNEFIVNRLSTV